MSPPALDDQLTYLYRLKRFETIKPGLATMNRLLLVLGNPHQKYQVVHIAGTNGKGSTAAFLASIIYNLGFNTGLYTSPYLRRFNERIRVNNNSISDEHLSKLIQQVRQAAERSHTSPTFFEFATALAFLYFAERRVDLAVVEAGMGGLLDATNVVDPSLSIITNVSLDHQAWLGRTKSQIARNKAGIIKPARPFLTAETDPVITNLFRRICDRHSAPCHILSDYISWQPLQSNTRRQTFKVTGPITGRFEIPLLGRHQVVNAATALAATNILGYYHGTAADRIPQGLATTVWEGRLQIINEKPLLIYDGAHNQAGIAALQEWLINQPLPTRKILIASQKDDKSPQLFTPAFLNLFEQVIVTESSFHPLPATHLASLIGRHHSSVSVFPQPAAALAEARRIADLPDMILATGSLYLIGDLLQSADNH